MEVDNPTLDDEAYSYDAVGNRTIASNTTGDILHNANNELTAYGAVYYGYDANGNLVRKQAGTAAVNYIYNAANRLVKVEDDLTGLILAEYGYDPFGRRLWKEVDGERTYFLYSDEGLMAEYDEEGNELRSYGWQPDSTWGTNPLWLKEGGEYYWYQNDHLGTPQKLIDSAGTVVWSATYTAFGEAQIEVETVTNNLRFPGQYYDAETGLHYNFHRYYDPGVGRYTRVDPIGFAGHDINVYDYAWNNPANHIDPDGRVWSWATTAVGGLIGGIGGFSYGVGTQTVSVLNGGNFDWQGVKKATAGGTAVGLVGGAVTGALAGDPSSLLIEGSVAATGAVAVGGGFVGGAIEGAMTWEEDNPYQEPDFTMLPPKYYEEDPKYPMRKPFNDPDILSFPFPEGEVCNVSSPESPPEYHDSQCDVGCIWVLDSYYGWVYSCFCQ